MRENLKAANQEERIQIRKEYLENLPENSPIVFNKPIIEIINSYLDTKLARFTQEELNLVLTKIKSGKAAGLEEIFTELEES